MEKYCSDKPDLRNPLIVHDLTKEFENTEFNAFKNKTIKVISAVAGEQSRKWYDEIGQVIVAYEGKGCAWVKFNEGEFTGSIVKFLTEENKQNLIKEFNLVGGESLFFVADTPEMVVKLANVLRNELGRRLKVTNKAVSKWERDLSCPDIHTMNRLSEVLEESLEELMQITCKPKKRLENLFNYVLSYNEAYKDDGWSNEDREYPGIFYRGGYKYIIKNNVIILVTKIHDSSWASTGDGFYKEVYAYDIDSDQEIKLYDALVKMGYTDADFQKLADEGECYEPNADGTDEHKVSCTIDIVKEELGTGTNRSQTTFDINENNEIILMDKENNVIYKGISSTKFLNSKIFIAFPPQ